MSDNFKKGGIGSGRRGHHSIGRDYSEEHHDSVFEDSDFDSSQERLIEMDRMKELMDRNDARAVQRIKDQEQARAGGHGMSRKTPPKFDTNKMLREAKEKKKSLWQRLLGKSEDSSVEKAKKKEPMEKNLETLFYLRQLMKKGGVGSGKRGHKSADYSGISGGAFGGGPASDTKREIDPEKKKKLIAGDKKAVKKFARDDSHEELQHKINQHKEMSESKFLSPASRESYAAKHKALLQVQKKKGPAPEAPKREEGVAVSKPGPFGGINKAEEMKKLLGPAIKTAGRVIQNLVKPAQGGDGSEADKPVGGYDGASVAGGVGGAKPTNTPKIKKSLLDRLQD